MITEEHFLTQDFGRKFPVTIYLPNDYKNHQKLKLVIFGNGFQGQAKFDYGYNCNKYQYLAKFFTNHNIAFISINFEVLGDLDQLPDMSRGTAIDQVKERTPIWIKDEVIILFTIDQLKQKYHFLNFHKFIIGGHSNGADVAKFFTNRHSEIIDFVFSLDGRRCPISSFVNVNLLSFEANDTTTDENVIPGKLGLDPMPNQREKISYAIIKPRNAKHGSYIENDNSPSDLAVQQEVCKWLEFYLKQFSI